ncbi:hypothetical protein GIS00_19120 [Nakamurella sp. YIM 132087]|uniref:Regulator of SigK n=1 Tax=Nakamurella alba TaxID=2665158 RepID=A0A7K1FPI1_9ACTN|nr:anti-sigma factor [Nakamurella alba]MTD16052.1 hypothetical protein [Nakamurella alba]
MTAADVHLNTGAMAVHALPPDETIEFATHLEDCPVCAAEMLGFGEATAMLGAAVAVTPPASLRENVLNMIRTIPQLPPLLPTEPVAPAEPAPAAAEQPVRTGPRHAREAAQKRWFRRTSAFIAAAAVVAALAIGTIVIVNRNSAPPTAAECVAEATDTRVIPVSAGTNAVARYSASCSAATVDPTSLPALPTGQVYQLWVLRGAAARSVGVMTQPTGATEPLTATVGAGDTNLGISVEPGPQGSQQPTEGSVIWVADL